MAHAVSAARKLLALWRGGGPGAVARALRRRFLYKRWRSLLFEHVAPLAAAGLSWPKDCRYEWLGPAAALSPANREALRSDGAVGLLEDLAPADNVYVVWAGDRIASYGVVMARSPQHAVVGLPPVARLVGLCETREAHRRRGLFSLALVETVRALRQQGTAPVFIEVDEANLPSRAGIVRAGFGLRGPVDAQIWFGRWVRRDGRWSRLAR